MIDILFAARRRLPAILQSERAECGLACLAMVACYHGHRIDMHALRRRYPMPAHGVNLAALLRIAHDLSLQTRAMRLEPQDLSTLQLPAILHWDMSHFVVLCQLGRNTVVLHDPAVGRREYSLKEIGRHFTGVAIECLPATGFKAQKHIRRSRLSELFSRGPGFVAALSQLFMLSLLIQVAAIGSAFYLQLIIDEGISKADRDILSILALAFLLLAMTHAGMAFARASVQMYFANQLGFQMAGNVFNHLMRLPVAFFAKRHVGDLVSRFGAIREIRNILSEDMITVILDGVFALITLAVMFYFDVMLASVVLCFAVLLVLLKLAVIPHLRSLNEQRIVAEAVTTSALMENMRAIEVLKFYCREAVRIGAWRNLYAEQINANVQLTRFSIRLDTATAVLIGLENILVIFLAALAVLDVRISLGFMTAFMALKGHFLASMRSLIDKMVQILLLGLHLDRVSDISCATPEFEALYLSPLRSTATASLRLEDIAYGYEGGNGLLLQGINLRIEPGQIVVVTGPSGAGKSTFLKIVAGLVSPDRGRVCYGDVDIRQSGLREYRDGCAGVLQTDQLLSGTLADNIALFSETVDHALMRKAARMARIDTFIESLPMSYNSLVGDMGSSMSAGEKQRVLLARAFYKNPRILLLDEATANLDEAVEQEILDEVLRLGITTVMITHRPAPLRIASTVLVCQGGSLLEASGHGF